MNHIRAHVACDEKRGKPRLLPRFNHRATKVIKAISYWGVVTVVTVGFTALATVSARAATINILCLESETGCNDFTGTTFDGVIFTAAAHPDPDDPSTGTGVFNPFVRTQTSGSGGNQSGFNTDASEPDINFDTKAGLWTRSLTMDAFTTITILGTDYFELQLDANEKGKTGSTNNLITINEMQIFIGSNDDLTGSNSGQDLANPEASGTGVEGTGYTGIRFETNNVVPSDNMLLGLAPVWNLDSNDNDDVNIVLSASICDNEGQCGSGFGDLSVLIPVLLLGDFVGTDFFVLYTEYSDVVNFGDEADAGFEEWSWRGTTAVTIIPLPAALPLFLTALMGLGGLTYRRRKKAAA